MIRDLIYTISAPEAGLTIEKFLRAKGCSHHILTGLKRTEDGIRLNEKRAYTSQILSADDTVMIHLEETESSPGIVPAPVPFSIVYEDEDLMVIDKPWGTPVHPSQGNHDNTLANGIADYFSRQGIPYVYRCINRLDRDTTGLLILAKHGFSGAVLSTQMMERKIRRTYRALVEGRTKSEGTVDAPIGRREGSIIERQVDPEHGEHSVTHYRTLEHFSLSALKPPVPASAEHPSSLTCSRIELKLETGRTHQIRVHMAYIGHPLLGDTLYRPENPSGMDHHALHSYSLEFTHPVTGKELYFSVPEPWQISGSRLRRSAIPPEELFVK